MQSRKRSLTISPLSLLLIATGIAVTGCASNFGKSNFSDIAPPEERAAIFRAQADSLDQEQRIDLFKTVCAPKSPSENDKEKCAIVVQAITMASENTESDKLSPQETAIVQIGKKMNESGGAWKCTVEEQIKLVCDKMISNDGKQVEIAAAETPAQEKVHLTRGKLVAKKFDKPVYTGEISAPEGYTPFAATSSAPYIHDASNASGDVATDATGRFTVKLPDQGPSLWKQIIDTNKAELVAQLSKDLSGAWDNVKAVDGWNKAQSAAMSAKTYLDDAVSAIAGATTNVAAGIGSHAMSLGFAATAFALAALGLGRNRKQTSATTARTVEDKTTVTKQRASSSPSWMTALYTHFTKQKTKEAALRELLMLDEFKHLRASEKYTHLFEAVKAPVQRKTAIAAPKPAAKPARPPVTIRKIQKTSFMENLTPGAMVFRTMRTMGLA